LNGLKIFRIYLTSPAIDQIINVILTLTGELLAMEPS